MANISVKDASGATVAAKYFEPGTPGVPAADVMTVQGHENGTPLAVSGRVANPSASFARPASTPAYTAGQLVANHATAGSVVPLALDVARVPQGSYAIRRVKLAKSSTSVINAAFRVHFYGTSPAPVNGDTGTWLTSQSGYLGSADVVMTRVFSNGACGFGVIAPGLEIADVLASGTQIFGLVEAMASYAGVAGETFTLSLDVWQN